MQEILEKFEFEDFKQQLENWLCSGRLVWGVFGNIDKDQAIQIGEKANKAFNLKPTAREDLHEHRLCQINKGEWRLDFKVQPETNDNSAYVTMFQLGHASSLKQAKLVDIIQ